MAVLVKICGVTRVDQAVALAERGVDVVGINLVPASPRRVTPAQACEIANALRGRARAVAVVADLTIEQLLRVRCATGIEWLQLHGAEPPAVLAAVLPHAYKALRIGDAADLRLAEAYAGACLLVDAKVAGVLGGSGHLLEWSLVEPLAERRRLILAGGLTPENVAAAIEAVRPFGVDVASGVEERGRPGVKDLGAVDELLARVREASASVSLSMRAREQSS